MIVTRQLECVRMKLLHNLCSQPQTGSGFISRLNIKANIPTQKYFTVSILNDISASSKLNTTMRMNFSKKGSLFPISRNIVKAAFEHQQRFVFLRSFTTGTRANSKVSFQSFNKNVSENVLVFSHENDSFYKFLSFFGVFQMLLWGYLSISPVQNLRPVPISKKEDLADMPWWKRWLYKEGQYKNAMTGIFLTVGLSILFITVTYPQRAVKSLWLLKGGKNIKITTHSQVKKAQSFSVPLDHVNCLQARTGSGTQIPLKIKKRNFFFLMDKQGTFHNPEIFDFVIGLKRNV